MSEHDVVIIGGGAAGLSAALVLARARRNVLVLDAGEPRNGPAAHMHGYLSRDGMPPADLLTVGRDEVKGYGGTIVGGTATDVVRDGDNGFWVLIADRRISTQRVLVTTGLHDELPDVPELRARWARDVLHCPYCHGHEVRDQQLGVIGGTPGAVRYAQIVRQWTHDLVYFTAPDLLTPTERNQLLARAIGIVEGTIDQLVIDDADHLRGVQMHDGCIIPRGALFVPRGSSRTAHFSPALAATLTPTAGSPSTRPDGRALPVSGPRATSSIRAHRSSPRPELAPPPRSRSTPTWSTTT